MDLGDLVEGGLKLNRGARRLILVLLVGGSVLACQEGLANAEQDCELNFSILGLDYPTPNESAFSDRASRETLPQIPCSSEDEVVALLESEFSSGMVDSNGRGVPHYAALSLDSNNITALSEIGVSFSSVEGQVEEAPLSLSFRYGVHSGKWENFWTIVNLGVPLDVRAGPANMTIAEEAVVFNRYEIALQLMELGYNRDLDKLKRYALMVGGRGDERRFHELLLERLADY